MRKAIWITFAIITLIWTTFAFLAAGLARWTSDVIASDALARTTQVVMTTTEGMAQKLTESTGRLNAQVGEQVAQMAGGATLVRPPLPEWVNQWLPQETVAAIEEWGDQAMAAANTGKAVLAKTVTEATARPRTMADDVASLEVEAASPAPVETAQQPVAAEAPWLAKIVDWLIPIVWVTWGVGMVFCIVLALCAQWGLARLLANPLPKALATR